MTTLSEIRAYAKQRKRSEIVKALVEHGGDISKAARVLKMARSTLRHQMVALGIDDGVKRRSPEVVSLVAAARAVWVVWHEAEKADGVDWDELGPALDRLGEDLSPFDDVEV